MGVPGDAYLRGSRVTVRSDRTLFMSATPPSQRTPPDTKRLRILVVDDDPDSRFLCQRVLERLGHDVTLAEEGVEAIGRLRDEPFDVVLTDHHMPGPSGIDVLERAFHLRPDAIRLLMSGIVDARTTEEAAIRGRAHAFIEKPLDIGAFEVRLAES